MPTRDVVIALCSATFLIIFLRRRYLEMVNQAISEFVDWFRGGPPSGPSPVPSHDGRLHMRRS